MNKRCIDTLRRVTLLGVAATLCAVGSATAMAKGELVLVAGATGKTGKRVVEQLVAADYKVRALARDVDAAKAVLPAGVEIVKSDVKDPATLEAPMKGVQYVVSAIGAGGMKPEPGNGPQEVDLQGNVNLVKAAQKANVKQFVLVSSAHTSKSATYPVPFMKPILAAKFESEEFLRKSGVPYTVVKPGGLHEKAGGEKVVTFTQGDVAMGAISRADLASVCIASLGREAAVGKTFEVVNGSTAGPTAWDAAFAALAADKR